MEEHIRRKLIEALKAPDWKWFIAILHEGYATELYVIALGRRNQLGATFEPNDIVQTVFYRLSEKYHIDRFSEETLDTIPRLLKKIAVNLTFDIAKRNRIFQDQPDEDVLPLIDLQIENIQSRLEFSDLLKFVTSKLTAKQRDVFKLFIKGYSHREIGKLLKMEESNSRQHLRQARRSLRQCLTREMFYAY